MVIKNFDLLRWQDKQAVDAAKHLAEYLDDRDESEGGRDWPCLRDDLADFIGKYNTSVSTGQTDD